MIALLHYAVLKTRRDGSLFLFLLVPAIVTAALIGASVAELRFEYPFALSRHMTPRQNARTLAEIVGGISIAFGAISAFWTFRAEMATRAISSFVVASRSLTVIGSLIAFGTLMAISGWICGMAAVVVLTATVPAKLPLIFAGFLAVSLALSSSATLIVAIAPQPANLLWAYLSLMIFIPWLEKSPDAKVFALAAIMAAVPAILSIFFLRRRCAT